MKTCKRMSAAVCAAALLMLTGAATPAIPVTVTITNVPATVMPGARITVEWTLSSGTSLSSNHVDWGTAANKLRKSTKTDKTVPYQASFTGPKRGTVYLRVHAKLGKKHYYSEVVQVAVVDPPKFAASGLALEAGTGAPIAGAKVTFALVSGLGAVPKPVETAADGSWSQTGFAEGATYTATPSLNDGGLVWTFESPSLEFAAASTLPDFTGTSEMAEDEYEPDDSPHNEAVLEALRPQKHTIWPADDIDIAFVGIDWWRCPVIRMLFAGKPILADTKGIDFVFTDVAVPLHVELWGWTKHLSIFDLGHAPSWSDMTKLDEFDVPVGTTTIPLGDQPTQLLALRVTAQEPAATGSYTVTLDMDWRARYTHGYVCPLGLYP